MRLAITLNRSSAEREASLAETNEELYNRRKLTLLYEQAQTFIQQDRFPLQLRNDLEFRFPQYENRLKDSIEQLQSSQCFLLFTGANGSGKSSLINLWLGFELLPTSDFQCTVTFVEIRYGTSPGITAYYRKNYPGTSPEPYTAKQGPSESLASFLEKVKFVITTKDEETDESVFERVHIEWPVTMLKGGVTIVDSPGFDSSTGLSQTMSRYLEISCCVVYVIDSNTNMHKHKLGQLLLKHIEVNDGFHSSTTLFVCNHWDKVPPADAGRVLDSTKMMLSMILPQDARIQLYPISVQESAKAVASGNMPPEHQQLLGRLHTLVPQSRKERLRKYYRYLSSFLQSVLHSIQISVNTSKEKVEEISKSITEVKSRLALKQNNAKEKLDKIIFELGERQFKAGCDILDYLNSMANRTMLAKWEDKDCPKKQKNRILSNPYPVKQAYAAIAERVAEGINKWEKGITFIKYLEDHIIQLFKEKFELLDEQLTEIHEALQYKSETTGLVQEVNGNNAFKNNPKELNNTKENWPSIGTAVIASFNFDIMEPKVIDLFNSQYDTDPSRVMKYSTDNYLGAMSDSKAVAVGMSKYFYRLLNSIRQIGAKVPDLLKAETILLQQLSEEQQQVSKSLQQLPLMEEKCFKIIGDMNMYFVERLIEQDFSTNEIICSTLIGRGHFAEVYEGFIRRASGDVMVALKIPKDVLKPDEVTDILLEECMLRNLKHSNIVIYYGMLKKEVDNGVRLNFVMEFCPSTLQDECINVKHCPSSFARNSPNQKPAIRKMYKYVTQINNALKYLHHKCIVHRDIKPENILLSLHDDVKLGDLGLASKVKYIQNSKAGTPIYIAPEVLLQNDKVSTKVDIYSFAMIMWQLWYGKDLSDYASQEIQCGLKSAIKDEWRPALSIVHAPDSFWSNLIGECWQQEPKRRPTAREIADRLSQYGQDLFKD